MYSQYEADMRILSKLLIRGCLGTTSVYTIKYFKFNVASLDRFYCLY